MTVKILLYSHDSWGLGHLRRTLAIAHQLNREFDRASILIATGSPCATQFPLERGVELIKLPSITKDSEGRYLPRQLHTSQQHVMGIRQALLMAAFEAFGPQLLIVDHQMLGLEGELLPLLHLARRLGTRCVYGMRDVLDNRAATEANWDSEDHRWAMHEAYDEIWIYGDASQFDTVAAYPALQPHLQKITFTGLIQNGLHATIPSVRASQRVLVTAGGGEDGQQLLAAYVRGLLEQPIHWHSTVVTGPLLDDVSASSLERSLERLPNTDCHRFHPSIPGLLRSCDAVVSMAGYNSCAEIIAARCPAVLVPRTKPRQEQLIRAQYLDACGVATCLVNPSSRRLMESVRSCLDGVKSRVQYPRTNGLATVSTRTRALLQSRSVTNLTNNIDSQFA